MVVGFGYLFNLDDEGPFKVSCVKPHCALVSSPLLETIPQDDEKTGLEKLKFHKVDLFIKADPTIHIYKNETSQKSIIAEKVLLQALGSQPSQVKVHSIEGERIAYVEWLFPGLLGMNILWMSLWGVGWVVVRHRKLMVLKRFSASPLTAFEYLLAQMVSRLIVLIATGILIFLGTKLIYPVRVEGSFLDLMAVYGMGCLCHSAIGMIVAARITSEDLANGILNMVTYPMIFLSEIWFSLEGSPEWVQNLAQSMPLWHMIDGMRRVMFEGTGMVDLMPSMIFLAIVTFVGLLIGAATFRWNP